jgi:hypothetical protein
MGIQTQMDLQMAKIEALQKRKGQDWVWNWEKRMDFPMEIDLGVKTENQMALNDEQTKETMRMKFVKYLRKYMGKISYRRISMANQKEKN